MTAGEAGIVAAAAAAAAADSGGDDDDDGGGGDDDGDGVCAGCADLLSWTRPPATQRTLRPEAARHHGRCW